jgi:succinate dehydrogenase / fumarate reductase membrane anchor subunit
MAERVSNQSLLTWFLQRISGLFLGFFLITHIDVHHLFHDITTHGIINFESVQTNLASSGWWKVYYFLFVPLVIFHGLNGIWQILADFRLSRGGTVLIKAALWILGAILVAVAAVTLTNLF